MQVAEEVRALMARRRMSGVQVAKAIGRSQAYMWRRLSGETAFDIDDLEALARVLDVDVTSLFPTQMTAYAQSGGGMYKPDYFRSTGPSRAHLALRALRAHIAHLSRCGHCVTDSAYLMWGLAA